MRNKTLLFGGIIGALVLLIGGSLWYHTQPGELDVFAGCLGEQEASFYGAFWCPHCQSQKALFGKSQKHLPYIECSTPDGRGQLDVCTEKGISGYPTWEFKDGERLSGEIPLSILAQKTGCPLP